MLNTAAEGIVMINVHGTVQLYNGAAQNLLGEAIDAACTGTWNGSLA